MGQAIGGSLAFAVGIALSPIPIIAVVLMLWWPSASSKVPPPRRRRAAHVLNG